MITNARLLATVPLACLAASSLIAQEPMAVRPQAVVNLTFDEESGDAADSATAGEQPDLGKLVNGVDRVTSPFWNQPGRRAAQLDAGRRQFIQLDDSPDLDRANAVTFGLFFINLHDPDDAGYHGLVAKRASEGGRNVTNYGINYNPKSDAFQLYVNDGSGYRVATFSVKGTIGARKMVYLTAVVEVGDAPEPDADTDRCNCTSMVNRSNQARSRTAR
jgi:hypothetical protein